jgi:(E)-4-hydroxy-3-methylbut-2-enyl-diphosphate synthase
MKNPRHKTRPIKIGNIYIGGNHPIAIQSMAKTKTANIEDSVKQINELERVGCEIVRVAIKDEQDAKALKRIKERVKIPVVADIHFNWRLALEAIDNGADKIRLNPGNIYKKEQIKEIVYAAKMNRIPIRVGVNSGSLINRKSKGAPCLPELMHHKSQVDSMVKSALDYLKILEDHGFFDIVVSLKASCVSDTIAAYRKLAGLCDYPLHLGVTASGPYLSGTIKSSIAIGSLLLDGIGDTIRVSLTEEPWQEVEAAKVILESLGLRNSRPQIISCPTCGRCEVDLVNIVRELEKRLSAAYCRLQAVPVKVAVMGCVVNGPGEAGMADIGVAFGKKEGLLFRKGRIIKKVSASDCINVLLKELGSD